MDWRTVGAAAGILLSTVACAHTVRVSRGALDRLKRNGDRFVLVFGSLSAAGGNPDRPVIRFYHPEIGGKPDTLLWSTAVAPGRRFYAVLQTPAGADYLDQFFVEAGSEASGFDRIIWSRPRREEEPLAMYVGEIEVRPALNRTAPGQKVVVETRDDFQNAQRELRRLYPDFDGAVVSSARTRPSAPPLH
jgi:hypothetical protein